MYISVKKLLLMCYSIFTGVLPQLFGVKPPDPQMQCGYQQWLKSEPGGYAFRERNSITGKWPVIETIPGIPKPTLPFTNVALGTSLISINTVYSFGCWCQGTSHGRGGLVQCNLELLVSLMVRDAACAAKSWIPVCPRLIVTAPLFLTMHRCMKTLVAIWSGACMGGHWRTGGDKPVQLNHRQYLKQCL